MLTTPRFELSRIPGSFRRRRPGFVPDTPGTRASMHLSAASARRILTSGRERSPGYAIGPRKNPTPQSGCTAAKNPNYLNLLGAVSASSARRIEVSGRERTPCCTIGPSCGARPKSNAAIDVLTADKNLNYLNVFGVVSASSARRILTSGRERSLRYANGPRKDPTPQSMCSRRPKMVATP